MPHPITFCHATGARGQANGDWQLLTCGHDVGGGGSDGGKGWKTGRSYGRREAITGCGQGAKKGQLLGLTAPLLKPVRAIVCCVKWCCAREEGEGRERRGNRTGKTRGSVERTKRDDK